MAVAVAEASLRGGSHMGKYEGGGCFGGETGKIHAVPCRNGGSEDARGWAEGRLGVVPYTETVAVMGTAMVL